MTFSAMKPTDHGFEYLVKTAYRRYDVKANRQRRAWLDRVRVDDDGCWTWVGPVSSRGFPRFGKEMRSAYTSMLRLWGVDADPGAYRRCMKRLCVRPSCMTVGISWYPDRPVQIRKLLAEGLCNAEIARALGLDSSIVGRVIRKFNLPRAARPSVHSAQTVERARRMRLAGDTLLKISNELGVPYSTVGAWNSRKWKKGEN